MCCIEYLAIQNSFMCGMQMTLEVHSSKDKTVIPSTLYWKMWQKSRK